MVLSEDADDHLFKKHQDLCSKLNLDVGTIAQAWESFQTIQTNYTLEGDTLHWLGCAVYVVCKKATTPTVGRTLVEGNGVNLTSLLRHCNLSLTQFFNKITKWADMANMSDDFRLRIKRVEGNFAVSYNIFKKFTPIFNEIFKGPIDTEPSRQPRNRKQRAPPCTPTKVFEFCWILFTTVKGENLYSEDIVMSYHLLQACCDLAFKNAFLDDRRDLLNPSFSELPSNWLDPNFVLPKEAPCIINYLCSKHNGLATEAKYCKEYSWKNHLTDLFTRGVLHGKEHNFTGLFDPAHFDANLKNLTKEYDAHLINRGDFDERIFLDGAMVTDSPRGEGSFPGTPGAARRSSLRLQGDFTPLSTATKSVARLQALLAGRQASPSEALIQIFQTCTKDPTEKIKQVVETIGEKFRTEFTRQNSNVPTPTLQPDYANQRLQLAITLFYKFVENIFQKEKTLHKDISHLAVKDIFYECTLACSLEIIIYSYNCQRKFPWVVNALNIRPFYFVRVIELIVRSQDQLPRDAVKHLNMVEQKIIESLIWKSDSPIWEVLNTSGEEFPKFEDTALPGNMVYTEEQAASGNGVRKPPTEQLLSPGPSAVDRFQSPVMNPPVTEIRKQLFKPVQSTKPAGPHIIVLDKAGNQQYIPLPDKQLESILSKSEPPTIKSDPTPLATLGRSKKTGSLSIILRKFYNLAYSRMEHLCTLLDISELKFRQKIWTVFEHSIREHTDLMRDRHLDQLLMCAVYVVCKVTSTRERKFAEIMEHYRVQPQASSHIYRNVLITRGNGNADANSDSSGNQTPNKNLSAESEKRGDLISFYNTVYVQAMRSFALQFSSSSNQNANITLSPLPLLVNNNFNLVSPRCQITNNLFIMPYDTPTTNCFNKGKTLEYHFSRSPSKDLEKINNAINKSIVGKRLLGDGDDDVDGPNKRFVSRKMQSLVEARRSHITE